MLTNTADYTFFMLFCVIWSYRSVEDSFNMSDEGGVPSLGVTRKKKIAIGVIFLLSPNKDENRKFQEFFFSHFPLFESHMNKLKSSIEQVWHICSSMYYWKYGIYTRCWSIQYFKRITEY